MILGWGVLKKILFSPLEILNSKVMSLESVEALLEKGGSDEAFRAKYNAANTKEEFVKRAIEDGYDFTVEELMQVVNSNGDQFESFGNPPKRTIWY